MESARLTRFSLLARPKGQPVRSWAWHSFLQKSCLNARGTWWEVDACKFARGEERRYTWHGSWEQLFVSTHCSLLLFKSEDEQVLRGTGWVLEQIRANIKGQTRRAHATADTQCSSEYSLFLRYTSSRAVLYVWFCFWFTLWLRLDLCLIDLFHFKAHKATFMATAALPHASIPHQHCRGPCSQLSLSNHVYVEAEKWKEFSAASKFFSVKTDKTVNLHRPCTCFNFGSSWLYLIKVSVRPNDR